MKAVLLALDTAKTPRTSKQVIVPLAKLKFQGMSLPVPQYDSIIIIIIIMMAPAVADSL